MAVCDCGHLTVYHKGQRCRRCLCERIQVTKLWDAQHSDWDKGTSLVRSLEMTVDSLSIDPGLKLQFWADAETYGFAEALMYLSNHVAIPEKLRREVDRVCRRR